MSLYDYRAALTLCSDDDPPFYALIMAAMLKADTDNVRKLRREWPEVWTELARRYTAPGGLLSEERTDAQN